MDYYFNWKKYWNKKSTCGPLASTGRSGSSISDLYLYLNSTINSLGGISEKDTILDAGGGAGYISMILSPFVKKIYPVTSARSVGSILIFPHIKAFSHALLSPCFSTL